MTNTEIQLEIAKRLGYKLEHREYPETFAGQVLKIRPDDWVVVFPDKHEFKLQVNDKYVNQEFLEVIPDWSDNVEDALELLKIVDGDLCYYSGKWSVTVLVQGDYNFEKCNEDPALAICETYLFYDDERRRLAG